MPGRGHFFISAIFRFSRRTKSPPGTSGGRARVPCSRDQHRRDRRRVTENATPARQRASNDKVLDGDLIANRSSSVKHKKGLVAENKRLFSQSHGSIRVRAIVRLLRERAKREKERKRKKKRDRRARSIYTCTARYRARRRGLTRSCRCNRSAGGHHESRACADIGANDNGGEGRRRPVAYTTRAATR